MTSRKVSVWGWRVPGSIKSLSEFRCGCLYQCLTLDPLQTLILGSVMLQKASSWHNLQSNEGARESATGQPHCRSPQETALSDSNSSPSSISVVRGHTAVESDLLMRCPLTGGRAFRGALTPRRHINALPESQSSPPQGLEWQRSRVMSPQAEGRRCLL